MATAWLGAVREPDELHQPGFEAVLGELEALRKRLLEQHRLELKNLCRSGVEESAFRRQVSPESHDICLSDSGSDAMIADHLGDVEPALGSSSGGERPDAHDGHVGRAESRGSDGSRQSKVPHRQISQFSLKGIDGQARIQRRPAATRGQRVDSRNAALTFTAPIHDGMFADRGEGGIVNRPASSMSLSRRKGCKQLLFENIKYLVKESTWFENLIRAVIILNSIYIGVEIQWSLDGVPPEWFMLVEHWFLVLFILELFMRVVADGRANLRSSWFLFDVSVVTLGALSTWVLEPVITAMSGGHPLGYELTAVRTLRLLRLVRLFRLSQYFKELWKMCRGMAQAGRAASSAMLLVLVAIYVFACVSVEAITREYEDDPLVGDIVWDRFRSLPVTMLTLMQFATEDSLNQVYIPIIERAPMLALYFGAVWLVVTVLIMNLVTAVIVESAIGQASQDRDMRNKDLRKKLKKMVPQLEGVFDKLDAEKAGEIWWEDIDLALVPLPEGLQGVIQEEMLMDLFSVSLEGSGRVRKSDFVEAVTLLAFSEVPVETTQMLHLLRHIQGKVLDLEAWLAGVQPDEDSRAPEAPEPLIAGFGRVN